MDDKLELEAGVEEMIPAQVMYDLREKHAFCSGVDLQEWFTQVVGEPSPPGRMRVPKMLAHAFVIDCVIAVLRNNSHGAGRAWASCWAPQVTAELD